MKVYLVLRLDDPRFLELVRDLAVARGAANYVPVLSRDASTALLPVADDALLIDRLAKGDAVLSQEQAQELLRDPLWLDAQAHAGPLAKLSRGDIARGVLDLALGERLADVAAKVEIQAARAVDEAARVAMQADEERKGDEIRKGGKLDVPAEPIDPGGIAADPIAAEPIEEPGPR